MVSTAAHGKSELRIFTKLRSFSRTAMVFLTAMKELPVTLLLAPSGYTTLATRIWSASSEAFYARAAAPALVLVLISALSLVYILDSDD